MPRAPSRPASPALVVALASTAFAVITACGASPPPATSPPPPAAPLATSSCAALDPGACAARPDCAVITAARTIPDHPCVLDTAPVGCMAADQACGDALTYARDPDNNVYWFADTCIPGGWSALPYPDGQSEPPPHC